MERRFDYSALTVVLTLVSFLAAVLFVLTRYGGRHHSCHRQIWFRISTFQVNSVRSL